MSYPKEPTKPVAPIKPTPPAKSISSNKSIGSCEISKYTNYSVDEFLDDINKNSRNINLKDVKLSFEIEEESTYYDERCYKIILNIYSDVPLDNPHYERQYNEYLNKLEQYEKDYQKYKEKLKTYKLEYKKWKITLDEYYLKQAESRVESLKKKLQLKK